MNSAEFPGCVRVLIGNRLPTAHHLLLAFVIVALSACSTSPQGRLQMATPAPVSDVYSDVTMRINLATAAGISAPCGGVECSLNSDFDQQVQLLGARLAKSAFDAYPDLTGRVSHFEFVVAEKAEYGSASNATGTVVIFRGVQKLYLDEQALAFVMAREMGHVIGHHHDENSAPGILLSVLVTVLFPAANILHGLHGSAVLADATSASMATTAATTAASSATSYIGSRMILASIRPDQLREADAIAVDLLAGLGWNKRDVAGTLAACTQVDGDGTWEKDFRISIGHVKVLEEEAVAAGIDLPAESPPPQIAQATAAEAGAGGPAEIDAKAGSNEDGANDKPSLNAGEENKSAGVVDDPVSEASSIAINTSRGDTRLAGTEIVAMNEVSISPEIAAKSDVTILEAKLEKQEVANGVQASAGVTKESKLPDRMHGRTVKVDVRTGSAQKVTRGASPHAYGSRTALRKVGLSSSKAAIGRKQEIARKPQVAKGSKVALGIRKSMGGPTHGNAKPAGATSGRNNTKQGKAKLGKAQPGRRAEVKQKIRGAVT